VTSKIKSSLAISAAITALVVGISAGSVTAATHIAKNKSSKSAEAFKAKKDRDLFLKSSSTVGIANDTTAAPTVTPTPTVTPAPTVTPTITPFTGDDGDDDGQEGDDLSAQVDVSASVNLPGLDDENESESD